ncbi:MAG: KOW domain-containing RNA-binding protein [Clostridiales bacterium]|jgi:ribosomal protein L14E/L6E/L27E|nr:KOW domain-containing RNA-binding protein [Clostridiales bacterium]
MEACVIGALEFETGQTVFSKAGHDKRKSFIIVGLDENAEYVYLADGSLRLIEKPKKKKMKHVQKTNEVSAELKEKIELKTVSNRDIAKYLELNRKKSKEDMGPCQKAM